MGSRFALARCMMICDMHTTAVHAMCVVDSPSLNRCSWNNPIQHKTQVCVLHRIGTYTLLLSERQRSSPRESGGSKGQLWSDMTGRHSIRDMRYERNRRSSAPCVRLTPQKMHRSKGNNSRQSVRHGSIFRFKPPLHDVRSQWSRWCRPFKPASKLP